MSRMTVYRWAVAVAITAGMIAAPTLAYAATRTPTAATTRTYATKFAGVTIRSLPMASRHSRVVARLATKGTKVTVSCYVSGQRIHGDGIWYRAIAPARGYVAGFNLASGHDPAHGIPHC
jgi:hypothetical protein